MVQRPHALWWVAVLGGMGLLGGAAYGRPDSVWSRLRLLPLPAAAYRLGFWVAWGEHVRKAAAVDRAARRAGLPPRDRRAWVRQTVVLGFPSALLFHQRHGAGR